MIFVIKLLDSFIQLNNFHAVMALYSGLNASPVLRLKHTQAEVPKTFKKIVSDCEQLMKSDGSFHTYREYLHSIDPPCIPYLGLYLTDLTFIEDGNKDAIEGLINVSKRSLCATIIGDIQQYQQLPYHFELVPQLKIRLERLIIIDEENLYKTSLQREPRNSERNQIQ